MPRGLKTNNTYRSIITSLLQQNLYPQNSDLGSISTEKIFLPKFTLVKPDISVLCCLFSPSSFCPRHHFIFVYRVAARRRHGSLPFLSPVSSPWSSWPANKTLAKREKKMRGRLEGVAPFFLKRLLLILVLFAVILQQS